MVKRIFCFKCANMRDADGHVTKDWGFGPRYFCVACAPSVVGMSDEPLSFIHHVQPSPQKEVTRNEILPLAKKLTMAAWVRSNAKRPIEDLVRELPSLFPESKPGKNPALSKTYVNYYLKGK